MVAHPNEHSPFDRPHSAGSFFINKDNVDLLWNELKEKENIFYSTENFEYGMREIALFDNNGYIIQFGQDIEEIKTK